MEHKPKLRPLGNHVLVSALLPETVSSGGIVIPDIAVDTRHKGGRVLAAGPRAPAKVGDYVIYSCLSGDEFEECTLLRGDHVLGIAGSLAGEPVYAD